MRIANGGLLMGNSHDRRLMRRAWSQTLDTDVSIEDARWLCGQLRRTRHLRRAFFARRFLSSAEREIRRDMLVAEVRHLWLNTQSEDVIREWLFGGSP